MRVGSVNVSFKSSKPPVIMGFDDTVSAERRDFIRKHIQENSMPYQEIYEKEGRLSEYELNNLVGMLTNFAKSTSTTVPLNENHNVKIYNLRKMKAQNSYRGQSLVAYLKNIKDIKDAGVRQVIDLVGFKDLKKACKIAGLEYHSFPVDYILWDESQYGDIIKAKSEVIKFIKHMQKEQFYIGCEWGFGKTDTAITMDYVFNPKTKSPQPNFIKRTEIKLLKNLYNAMDTSDLTMLGYNDTNKYLPIEKLNLLEKKMQDNLSY